MARMLIVEGEDPQHRALSVGLNLEGFEATFVGSMEDAISVLTSAAVDVALIDLMMPDVNGLDLARQIRRGFPKVRIVLSSTYHLSARQVARADCGAVAFVPKPYRVGELCRFLRSKASTVSSAPC